MEMCPAGVTRFSFIGHERLSGSKPHGKAAQIRIRLAQLQQPVQPQIAHALEVTLVEPGRRHHLGEQCQRRRCGPPERRQSDEGGVGADLGLELRAQASQPIVEAERN